MGEVALILLGVVLGIAGDEGYSYVKSRVAARRTGRLRQRLEQAADPVRHTAHLLEIFRANDLSDQLVRTTTTRVPALLPLVVDRDDRFVGDRILHESDAADGDKPLLLGTFRGFDEAVAGPLRPVVISATAACVFEHADGGREVALQRRSDRVVTPRGMYAVAPVFGLEPNVLGWSRSRFGLVTYNVLKEILEEFFDEEELSRAADQPVAAHPDWVFHSEHGRRLVAELDAGRLRLRCTGAAIDISDGSVVLAVLTHFTSPAYADELKLTARGSWESATAGGPRIEFAPLDGRELTALMTADTMTASSIFSLDWAPSRACEVRATGDGDG
ncbi:hypothetical protein [Jiangella alkaliphila]|uniref:Uncharacterized protein n=1 Tax=Jiangella alkaliphila TaxID=419479 RepID=A0A1H2JB83_9ACTN|nr:hypothetical protein [Jiangella alkaliphila]SDU53456.1 hypothetical protein SAMN04488563_2487 [Jiangella alkaliphila]